MKEYNGFTEKERLKGNKIIKKAIKDGLLPQLNTVKCEMCGQDKGIRHYHNEDYTPENIIQDAKCLCFRCHMHIHSNNKNSKSWQKYEEDIKNGEIYPPVYNKTYWTPNDDKEIIE